MPNPKMYTPEQWAAGRAEMVKRTYGEYADPDTGELLDPKAFQDKVVQNMYKYGDVEGVREFTGMQKQNAMIDRQNAYMDRLSQMSDRQGNQDALRMGGAAADALSNTYNTFQKQYGKDKADEMIAPLYQAMKEPLANAGVPMADTYDHNAASLWAKQYRSWLGKDINKDETGDANDPAQIKIFKQLYPGVALNSPAGRAQYYAHEQALKNDPILSQAVQMTIADPRTIKMAPDELQQKIQQNYAVIQGGRPRAGGPAGRATPAGGAPSGIPAGFTQQVTNKTGRVGYKNPSTGQIYIP